jgi:hypothetical protein
MESGRYAPIFTILPSTFYAKRQLAADERRTLNQPALAGRLPPLATILRRGWRYRYDAGLELGRRFRDQIRIKRAAGRRVTTWQLDELPSELAGRSGARMRGFMVGVMRGIAYGRPRLADRWLPGIVFATPEALAVGARRGNQAWQGFWRMADAVSLYLVGEEYPAFVGRPSRAARRMDLMRRHLARAGTARRSLAERYIAGMTPGYRLLGGLGGNVHGLSRSRVAHWRGAYVRARAREPLRGLGEYLLAYGNARAAVLDDVVSAMIGGLRIMQARG